MPIRLAAARAKPARAVLLMGGIAALGFGGCAQSPTPQVVASHHPKEYFPSSVYGPASRRVIEDGQPIPRGGGQYLVGKPYTIAGQTYYPSERKITQVGYASWYGDAFHGRLTANGEIYDRDGLTAAHPTMPLPSYARVTNLHNHYSMIVRVNDRGPYHSNRIMDVSRRVAEALQFERGGTERIKVEYVGKASLAGSDDAKLYATLHTDRPVSPAGLGTMLAAAATAPARIAYAAAAVTLGDHPERLVEDQRPAALQAYRAPPTHSARAAPETHEYRRAERVEEASMTPPKRQAASPRFREREIAEAQQHQSPERMAARSKAQIRVAATSRERSTSVQARTIATRELAPMPVRRIADARPTFASSHALRGSLGGPGLPPARPVHFASASPAVHHAASGSRLTRSRVD